MDAYNEPGKSQQIDHKKLYIATIFLRSDTMAILFKGGVYFFRKPIMTR